MCHYEGGKANWTSDAFDPDGMLKRGWVRISRPAVSNCGGCHGLIDSPGGSVSVPGDYRSAAYPPGKNEPERFQLTRFSGSIYSSQDIEASFLNLSGKQDLNFPWDVHARKLLQCTDCHFAPNDPQRLSGQGETIASLRGEPRRETLSQYLKQPDHRLVTANCRTCHDPLRGHGFLPYPERHFQVVACESCHIPRQFGPAEQMVDATLLDESGSPLVEYRGVEGEPANLNTAYAQGFEPSLMAVEAGSGEQEAGSFGPSLMTARTLSSSTAGLLETGGIAASPPPPDTSRGSGVSATSIPAGGPTAPTALVSRWFWTSGDSREPVPREVLQQALLENGRYRQEVIAALDTNHDGRLDRFELKLDTVAKQKTVERLLVAAGVKNPVIRSEVSVHKISHGVAPKSYALSDCLACHSPGSRLEGNVLLASRAPGGVVPVWKDDTRIPGRIVMQDEKVVFTPDSAASRNLYIFGLTSKSWPDRLGLLLLAGVVLAVSMHGVYRVVALRRSWCAAEGVPTPARSLGAAADSSAGARRQYLFTAYERIWHWVMALSVLALILTGIQVHFGGAIHLFGAANAVAIHNFFAAVLVLNSFLALFYHLATAAIRQFLPSRKGVGKEIKLQTRYYLRDIFKALPAPFSPSAERKLNVLQQISYLLLLNVLFPFQIITGVMVWLVGKSPDFAAMIGGLHLIAPLHNLGSWMLISFLVAHVYLATTGHTVFAHLRAMIDGYEAAGPQEVVETGLRAED